MSEKDIQNARGFIESIKVDEIGNFTISGWILSLKGPFDKVILEFKNESILAERVIRKDVGEYFSWLPNADKSGYQISLSSKYFENLLPPKYIVMSIVGINRDGYCAKIRGGYYRSRKSWVAPPKELMMRVAHNTNPEYFYATGMKTCIEFLHYLKKYKNIKQIKTMLDWGCGCGRLTPHLLNCMPNAEIYGADIDKESIEFAKNNYPTGNFKICLPQPPISYDDSSFDVILAGSVFTHLTNENQMHWIKEMKRLLKTKGVLIATTHGKFAGSYVFRENFDTIFENGIYDDQKDETLDNIAPPNYYRATFQTKEYTLEKWGGILNCIDYIEAGYANFQDVFILQKN